MTNVTTPWPDSWLGREIIAISPHPDDLAFSAFGLMSLVGFSAVTVVTVFTRSVWAPLLPNQPDEAFVSALREQEDQEWCYRMGVDRKALRIPDAGLRGYDQITERKPMRFDDPAQTILCQQLGNFPDNCIIFCPLAIGDHVDHVIVRNVIRDLPRTSSNKKMTLVLYEDLPYANEFGPARVLEYAKSLVPTAVPFFVGSSDEMQVKLAELKTYESQIRSGDLLAVSNYAEQLSIPNRWLERWWVLETFDSSTFFGDANEKP